MQGFKLFVENLESTIISDYLHNPELQLKELAAKHGKSKAAIYRILKNSHVQPNRLKKNHEKVVNLSHLGYKNSDIAGYSGYTERNIRYILKKMKEV